MKTTDPYAPGSLSPVIVCKVSASLAQRHSEFRVESTAAYLPGQVLAVFWSPMPVELRQSAVGIHLQTF